MIRRWNGERLWLKMVFKVWGFLLFQSLDFSSIRTQTAIQVFFYFHIVVWIPLNVWDYNRRNYGCNYTGPIWMVPLGTIKFWYRQGLHSHGSSFTWVKPCRSWVPRIQEKNKAFLCLVFNPCQFGTVPTVWMVLVPDWIQFLSGPIWNH